MCKVIARNAIPPFLRNRLRNLIPEPGRLLRGVYPVLVTGLAMTAEEPLRLSHGFGLLFSNN